METIECEFPRLFHSFSFTGVYIPTRTKRIHIRLKSHFPWKVQICTYMRMYICYLWNDFAFTVWFTIHIKCKFCWTSLGARGGGVNSSSAHFSFDFLDRLIYNRLVHNGNTRYKNRIKKYNTRYFLGDFESLVLTLWPITLRWVNPDNAATFLSIGHLRKAKKPLTKLCSYSKHKSMVI